MNSDAPHLTTNSETNIMHLLPEIQGEMMSYLSTADLISCSQVSSKFEEEARRHLSKRTLHLAPGRLQEYLQVYAVRNNIHNSISIAPGRVTPREFVPLLDTLIQKNYNTLKQLSIAFGLERELPSAKRWQYFKLFARCPNLTWIGLHPFTITGEIQPKGFDPLEFFYDDIIPSPELFCFKKVSTFEIDVSLITPIVEEQVAFFTIGLLSRLGLIFPNVKHLNCKGLGRSTIVSLFQGDSVPFRNMTFLSICTNAQFYFNQIYFDRFFSFECQYALTRLELTWNTILNGSYSFLMAKFCNTLQHVGINVVHADHLNQWTWWKRHLYVPAMPVLKELKVIHKVNPTWDSFLCRYLSFDQMDSYIQSEPDFKYAERFPALERLTIKGDMGSKAILGISEIDYFSIMATFMYNTFLPGSNECRSLKELDIPIPPFRGKFKVRKPKRCSCNRENNGVWCACWVWVESSTFIDRVMTTFPNVKLYNRFIQAY